MASPAPAPPPPPPPPAVVTPPYEWQMQLFTQGPGQRGGVIMTRTTVGGDGVVAVAGHCVDSFRDAGGRNRTCGGLPDPSVTLLGPRGEHLWTWMARDGLSGLTADVLFTEKGDVIAQGWFSGAFQPAGRPLEGFDARVFAQNGGMNFLASLKRADGKLRWVRAVGGSDPVLDGRGVVHLADLPILPSGEVHSVVHGFDVESGKPVYELSLGSQGACAPQCSRGALSRHPTEGVVNVAHQNHQGGLPIVFVAQHVGSDGRKIAAQRIEVEVPVPGVRDPRLMRPLLHPSGEMVIPFDYWEDITREGRGTVLVRLGPDLRVLGTVIVPGSCTFVGSLGDGVVFRRYVSTIPRDIAEGSFTVLGATLPPPDETDAGSVLGLVELKSGRVTTFWAPRSRQLSDVRVEQGLAVFSGNRGLFAVRLSVPAP
ncbi:uncharacterized protein CMC5_059730 [Chondromyces crocatus]|uniref:Uncharacterized protein n=2 Tax=Chondromyces crocatus TaxID=52 RepID=A0A0K1EM87_CHOCO|nr:uncharacterized protein CMC5_059730 [Chondromyces crocatus]